MRRDGPKIARAPVLSPDNRLRGCSGKRQYETFVVAKRIAEQLRRHRDDSIVEAYKCRHCHHFHLGEPAMRRDKRKDLQQ